MRRGTRAAGAAAGLGAPGAAAGAARSGAEAAPGALAGPRAGAGALQPTLAAIAATLSSQGKTRRTPTPISMPPHRAEHTRAPVYHRRSSLLRTPHSAMGRCQRYRLAM